MRRYTTPTLTLQIDEPALADVTQFYVTIRQCPTVLTLSNMEISTTNTGIQLVVDLTQLQTAGFVPGKAQVQVNWYDEGVRGATEIVQINITDNLLNAVIDGEEIDT